jgi:hypothetical protein
MVNKGFCRSRALPSGLLVRLLAVVEGAVLEQCVIRSLMICSSWAAGDV